MDLPEFEETIGLLQMNEFTPFKFRKEVKRCLMRVLCELVEEQVLLSGVVIEQSQPLIAYSMVKKGEVVNSRSEEPELSLLVDKQYRVTSTCLVLMAPVQKCLDFAKDYQLRACGDLLVSEPSSSSNSDDLATQPYDSELVNISYVSE